MNQTEPKVGGQAVIEGVMLKNDRSMAVVVRRNDGTMAVKTKDLVPPAKRIFVMRWPFVRGFLMLFSLLTLGIEALKFSVDVFEEGERAGKGETDAPQPKTSSMFTFACSAALALGFTVFFFFLLPLWITEWTAMYLPVFKTGVWFNVLEGVVRVLIFLGYLISISFMKDIRRVFEYHGAEHKVIATHERGEELIPENAERHSRLHPRCGTSFLVLVVLLSIVFFSLFHPDVLWEKVALRIVAFPILSGIVYELLPLQKFPACRSLFLPGIYLQYITTREPSRDQLEVAIEAFKSLKQ